MRSTPHQIAAVTTRCAVAAGLLATLVVSSGCASGTLREGIWRLRYQARVTQTGKPYPIDAREVELRTGFDQEQGTEIIELLPLEKGLAAAYGEIVDRQGSPTVQIGHLESGWNIRMQGVAQTPEAVIGEFFLAKSREFEDLTLDGRWDMRWLREFDE